MFNIFKRKKVKQVIKQPALKITDDYWIPVRSDEEHRKYIRSILKKERIEKLKKLNELNGGF